MDLPLDIKCLRGNGADVIQKSGEPVDLLLGIPHGCGVVDHCHSIKELRFPSSFLPEELAARFQHLPGISISTITHGEAEVLPCSFRFLECSEHIRILSLFDVLDYLHRKARV